MKRILTLVIIAIVALASIAQSQTTSMLFNLTWERTATATDTTTNAVTYDTVTTSAIPLAWLKWTASPIPFKVIRFYTKITADDNTAYKDTAFTQDTFFIAALTGFLDDANQFVLSQIFLLDTCVQSRDSTWALPYLKADSTAFGDVMKLRMIHRRTVPAYKPAILGNKYGNKITTYLKVTQ